jgi:hypothetical protein
MELIELVESVHESANRNGAIRRKKKTGSLKRKVFKRQTRAKLPKAAR